MQRAGVFFQVFLFSTFIVAAQDARKAGENKYENFLSGTSWKVNNVPFGDKRVESYFFSTYDVLSFEDQMGHFITFEETTFSTHYDAPCGNDCFTSVYGSYWFTAESRIRIKVKSIQRSGFCDKGSEILNHDYGEYDLVKQETGWSVVKVN